MGIASVRDAFNRAAAGKATAERALMSYVNEHDVEMQVLAFSGSYADGTKLEVTRKCQPGTNLETEAAAAAADAVKSKETPQ